MFRSSEESHFSFDERAREFASSARYSISDGTRCFTTAAGWEFIAGWTSYVICFFHVAFYTSKFFVCPVSRWVELFRFTWPRCTWTR